MSSLTLKRVGYLSSPYFMYVLSFKAFQEQDTNLLFITSFVLTGYKVLCTKNDPSRVVTVLILSLRLVSHLFWFVRNYLKMQISKSDLFIFYLWLYFRPITNIFNKYWPLDYPNKKKILRGSVSVKTTFLLRECYTTLTKQLQKYITTIFLMSLGNCRISVSRVLH